MQTLVKRAISLFIFTSTACQYTGDEKDNPKECFEIFFQYQMTTQVSRLDKKYLSILNQLFDIEEKLDKERQTSRFQEVVGNIVVLKSFLSILSLVHLLNTSKENIKCRLNLLYSVFNIVIDKDILVRYLSLSFYKFFLNTQKCKKSPFRVDKKKTYKKLANNCF